MMLRIVKSCRGWLFVTVSIVAHLMAEDLALWQRPVVLKKIQTRPKLNTLQDG